MPQTAALCDIHDRPPPQRSSRLHIAAVFITQQHYVNYFFVHLRIVQCILKGGGAFVLCLRDRQGNYSVALTRLRHQHWHALLLTLESPLELKKRALLGMARISWYYCMPHLLYRHFLPVNGVLSNCVWKVAGHFPTLYHPS